MPSAPRSALLLCTLTVACGDASDGGLSPWETAPKRSALGSLEPVPGCWSYSTTYNGVRPKGTLKRGPNLRGPAPTHKWYSSLVWNLNGDNPYSQNVYPHPLAVRAQARGLSVFYPTLPAIGGDGRTGSYM